MSEIIYLNQEAIKTFTELEMYLKNNDSGILLIKPRVLLKQLEEKVGIPVQMNLQVPSSTIGSILTLEATILVTLQKLLNPSYIFEFGTFLGYSTALFLNNSEAQVFSLDLNPEVVDQTIVENLDVAKVLSDDRYNDKYLSALNSLRGEIYLTNFQTNTRLKLIKQDSLLFNPRDFNLNQKIGLIFVDGGHTEEIIASDTSNSFEMLSEDGLIVWHDFNSSLHTQVSLFLNKLSKKMLILHVENTMLAIAGPGLKKL